MKRKLFLFIISLFVLSASFCRADVVFPQSSGFINDYVGILSVQQKQELAALAQSLKQNDGAELAVAIVKTTQPLDSKTYAVKLFEKWGIGQKGKNNGALLLLATEDRRIEIEVGYGLEGKLPDSLAGRILDTKALPSFKKGDYGEGLVAVAKSISNAVAGKEIKPLTQPTEKKVKVEPVSTLYMILLIVGVIVLGIVFKRTGSIFMGILGVMWGAGNAGLIGAVIGGLAGLIFGFWGLLFFTGGRGGGGGFSGGFGGGRSGGGGAGRSF